jgi:hypothetical protein
MFTNSAYEDANFLIRERLRRPPDLRRQFLDYSDTYQ